MNAAELIKKKRNGKELSAEEIRYLIEGYTKGEVPDYQISAFLMSVYFQGMNAAETAALVNVMLHSGKTLDLGTIKAPILDKHSTGGIGDKPTLILAPLLAAVGITVPTMSGRGLGHTGGTLDKLESIPGIKVRLPLERFRDLAASTGLAFMGQSDEVCPADRLLYALRDVTGTVESTPLIVGSIMSKKLAEDIDGIVFDVTCGSGAFMKTQMEAEALAQALVNTARQAGKKASALVTDMNQPRGRAVGNAIEINEAVAFLRQGPGDAPVEQRLREVTLEMATEMYLLAEDIKGAKRPNPAAVREKLIHALDSGAAYSKFLECISLQGGFTEAVDHGLPLASKKIPFTADKKGFIGFMDAERIGYALIELGGGRRKTTDAIDPSVGFYFEKHIGDAVSKGETIAFIYARDTKTADAALQMLKAAVPVVNEEPTKPKLIRARL